jgi:glycosyltransferase involved in cell wall biosynthesis
MKILEVGWEGNIGVAYMGPVTNVIFQLTRKFAELGHDVTLATGPTTAQRGLMPNDVRVVECGSATSMRGNPMARRESRLSANLKHNSQYAYIKELASTVDLESFDVIHTHLHAHAAVLQRELRTNSAYTIHTPQEWSDPARYDGMRGFVRRAVKQVKIAAGIHEINVIREAWLAIALGQFVEREVRGGNIVVIPNGINLNEWPEIKRETARAELGFKDDEFVILFAASIRPSKGLAVLLRAVRSLSKKKAGLKLVVLGHSSDELEEQTSDLPVELRGFISNRTQTFRTHLSAADVVAVPSLSDNQPTIVLEAMAMGVPVVASRVGAVPDMVSSEVGLLFDPGNHTDLAASLELLWREPSRREGLARKCRQHVAGKFTWDAAAKAHIAAFERTLAQNGT